MSGRLSNITDLYQPAETLTHRRHRLRRARCQYPIGPPYVFAMDVPVGRRQDESKSASFGISRSRAILRRSAPSFCSLSLRVYGRYCSIARYAAGSPSLLQVQVGVRQFEIDVPTHPDFAGLRVARDVVLE